MSSEVLLEDSRTIQGAGYYFFIMAVLFLGLMFFLRTWEGIDPSIITIILCSISGVWALGGLSAFVRPKVGMLFFFLAAVLLLPSMLGSIEGRKALSALFRSGKYLFGKNKRSHGSLVSQAGR